MENNITEHYIYNTSLEMSPSTSIHFSPGLYALLFLFCWLVLYLRSNIHNLTINSSREFTFFLAHNTFHPSPYTIQYTIMVLNLVNMGARSVNLRKDPLLREL